MQRLVVGVDRSPGAQAALDWAESVADLLGAELVAVSAWQPEQSELPPEEFFGEHRELTERLGPFLFTGGGRPRPRRRGRVVDGAPVEVIIDCGRQEGADLLVVGVPGPGGSQLRIGTVTDGVARRTNLPLALIPANPGPDVRRILLGVDGSEGAARAATWCTAFAHGIGAEVIAAYVHTQQLELVPERDPSSMLQSFVRDLAGPWTAVLREMPVPVTTTVIHDASVSAGLSRAAGDADVDVIVVGTHRRARLTHWRLGGSATRLAHTTPRPLVLVPPADVA
jgi:nucleotide-binding universal stress UspA family protein